MSTLLLFAALLLTPSAATAAENITAHASSHALLGAAGPAPGLAWGIPFVGVLVSIALGPTLARGAWPRVAGLVMAGWSLAFLGSAAVLLGPSVAGGALGHALLNEYIPFISLLLALYVAGGGILVSGGPWGSPAGNTLLLAIGTFLGSVIGTTAAAMVFIHPLLRANADRKHQTHLVVFFIVLVANVGGALSPVGDPPIYMGFLQGVPFFWPLRRLLVPTLLVAVPLLLGFYVIDRHLGRREVTLRRIEPLRVVGIANAVLIAIVVASVAGFGSLHLGTLTIVSQQVPLARIVSTVICLAVSAISLVVTRESTRHANLFAWQPIQEVAEVFVAIFITIGPVLAMLRAGSSGPLAGVVGLVTAPDGAPIPLAYFWLTGALSSFLDNAPTYLVFFGLAGGDPALLSGPLSHVLEAISIGAVFFGGLSYIGNAPNLMVRAVAEHRGVPVLSFLAYSGAALLTLIGPLLLITLVAL